VESHREACRFCKVELVSVKSSARQKNIETPEWEFESTAMLHHQNNAAPGIRVKTAPKYQHPPVSSICEAPLAPGHCRFMPRGYEAARKPPGHVGALAALLNRRNDLGQTEKHSARLRLGPFWFTTPELPASSWRTKLVVEIPGTHRNHAAEITEF
jgi:hypothetical protein